MTVQRLLMFLPLLALLGWAAVEDMRRRRIPNWLTFSLVLAGLALAAMSLGAGSMWSAFLGLAIGFAVTLVLHMLGALGAGDVKLMAGVGAWVGPYGAIAILAGASIVGMVLSIVQSARHGRLRALFRDSTLLSLHLLQSARAGAITSATVNSDPAAADPARRPLPFAVCVVISSVAVIMIGMSGAYAKWVMLP